MYLRLERKASILIACSVEREVKPGPVVYVQKSHFHLIDVFSVVIVVKKCILVSPGTAVFSYFVLHRSKMPLVLTIKVTRLRSLLFREQDRDNSVAKRVYLAITAKLIPKDYCS